MILTDEEALERVESPLNLLNRLKASTNRTKKQTIPSLPPKIDEVISDLEEKIAYGSIKTKAMGIMTAAMDELQMRIHEVKPESLARVAADMSRVINTTQVKYEDNRKQAQIVIYAPQLAKETQFETIEVLD